MPTSTYKNPYTGLDPAQLSAFDSYPGVDTTAGISRPEYIPPINTEVNNNYTTPYINPFLPNVAGQDGLYQSPELKKSITDAAGAQPNLFGDYIVPGIQSAAAIGNWYLSDKALDLSNKQANLGMAQWNRNLELQGGSYNTNLELQQSNRMNASGKYEDDPAAFEADLAAYVENNKVDTSAITV